MRWVVYTLLAVNLALLTWNLHTHGGASRADSSPAPAPVEPPDDPAELPLLAEIDRSALRPRATAPPVAGSPANPDPESPPTASAESPPDATAQRSSPPPTSSATEPATAGPAPDDPARTADTATSPAAASPPRTCLTIGPLDADADLGALQIWLEEQGAKVDVRRDERREVALYWVYFPPRASREQAVAEVLELRNRGIDDIIVVPKGDMANAISLGVFSRPENRDRRLRELNDKGYQPSIGPRYRTKVATWIDLAAPAGDLDEQAITARWPEIEVASKPCPAPRSAATLRRFHFSGQGVAS